MNCQEFRDSRVAFLDGEAEATLRPAMEKHAAECEGCRKELETLRRADRLLGQYGAPKAPPDFAGNLLRRVAPAPVSIWRRPVLWRAAAAVVVIGFGAALYVAVRSGSPAAQEIVKEERPKAPAPEDQPVRTPVPLPPEEPKAPPVQAPVEQPRVAEAPTPQPRPEDPLEAQLIENLDVLEDPDFLDDPVVQAALALPDEDFETLLVALEEGM